MRIVKASAHIESIDSNILIDLERIGRVCYKSEANITTESAAKFVRSRIDDGHESVIEHKTVTVRFIVDRGVSHEIVRHRIASYSQESTRYCNYGHEGHITVIQPPFIEPAEAYKCWAAAMQNCEAYYLRMIGLGVKPQIARSVLPNSLKTELVMTANLREWRHFFKLRCSPAAHPQMREVTIPLLKEFQKKIPVVFEDINA